MQSDLLLVHNVDIQREKEKEKEDHWTRRRTSARRVSRYVCTFNVDEEKKNDIWAPTAFLSSSLRLFSISNRWRKRSLLWSWFSFWSSYYFWVWSLFSFSFSVEHVYRRCRQPIPVVVYIKLRKNIVMLVFRPLKGRSMFSFPREREDRTMESVEEESISPLSWRSRRLKLSSVGVIVNPLRSNPSGE